METILIKIAVLIGIYESPKLVAVLLLFHYNHPVMGIAALAIILSNKEIEETLKNK